LPRYKQGDYSVNENSSHVKGRVVLARIMTQTIRTVRVSSASIFRQLSPLNCLGSKFFETAYFNRIGWMTAVSGTYPIDQLENNRAEISR
jgi:hypothetical protein